MRGLDHIAAMRRKGWRPPFVGLTDALSEDPTFATYAASDAPELEDLRALVGLIVVIDGRDPGKVSRWCSAAMKAGAKTVLGCEYTGHGDRMKSIWTDYRINGADQ